MKRFLLLILFAFPTLLMGQEIKSEVDEFTGDKIISTSWERIHRGGGTARLQTRMKLKNVNGTNVTYFRIFTDEVRSMSKGNMVMFKTSSGVTKLKNTEYAVAAPGEYSPNPINGKLGIYFKCSGDFSRLGTEKVQKIRFYFNDGYSEIELKQKESDGLLNLFKAFNKAVVKARYGM